MYQQFPTKPGVYYFKDVAGEIIYIGKALSLRHRVASYFNKNVKDPKTRQLVSQIKSASYILANSEFEALLLEAKLIKEHRPKYNVQLKDGKRYLYIAVSKEECPRIWPIRRVEIETNLLDWYGPFPSAGEVRMVLKTIRRIFPYRTGCKVMAGKPCLDYQINLCPGTCFKEVPEYSKTITLIRQILAGKTTRLIKILEKKMGRAAEELNFEEASRLKRQITALAYVTTGWRSVPTDTADPGLALTGLRKLLVKFQEIDPITMKRVEGYDISNLGKDIIVGSMAVFIDGRPEKGEYRKFKIRQTAGQNDIAGIKEVVGRRLGHREWLYPQLILIDGGKGQVGAAFEAIRSKNLAGQIALLGLAKKAETIIIPKITTETIKSWRSLKLARDKAELRLLQAVRDEAHRFARRYYMTLHARKIGKH